MEALSWDPINTEAAVNNEEPPGWSPDACERRWETLGGSPVGGRWRREEGWDSPGSNSSMRTVKEGPDGNDRLRHGYSKAPLF